MDYKKVFETMVDETEKYLVSNNLRSMVLGISGGIDSTLTASICHEVQKRKPNLSFFGVSLPCTSNTEEENDSAKVTMEAFCKKGQYWTENLQKESLLLNATCRQRREMTPIRQGNIKARLRMIYLYDVAGFAQGLVIDTGNKTEYHLGFWTIHGDVGDLNPIGDLWKHEIYELVTWLHDQYYTKDEDELRRCALHKSLMITPTDGNGVNGLGDMGQIAIKFANEKNVDAYRKVDDIIFLYLTGQMEAVYAKYDKKTVDGIIRRIRSTEYKRRRLPIVIDRELYDK